MRIALVSKYPPIEGQVSTVNYWLARGLAQRGHQVTVVTNAQEVEPACRLWMADGQESWPQPRFADRGGEVRVLQTAPADSAQFHIPWSNPFVTKLAGLALHAVRNFGCELIFSHYLEPYSIAGHLAANWTGVPHVITHSGSDIGRLMKNPALAPTYLEIIQRAKRFVPKNRLARSISRLPLTESDVLFPYAPPEEYFNTSVSPLDLNSLLTHAAQYISEQLRWHSREFDSTLPTFGFYGKLFEVKGIFDLIAALAKLRQKGFKFNLILISRWRRGEDKLRDSIVDAGLKDSTWLLPFLPNWQIPGFIRLCTAVCYLEREWPMPLHTAVVPREVMACGGCLIISEEVRRTGWYRNHLEDRKTCLAVEDPTNGDLLASRLQSVLEEPQLAVRIGEASYHQTLTMPDHAQFLSGWEKLFSACLGGGEG